MHLINRPESEIKSLARSLVEAKQRVQHCSICGNLTDADPCEICGDEDRDCSTICVLGDSSDVVAMEKTREYHGRYHVLGGVLSPMDGIGPEELRIGELLERLRDGKVREVIVATDPTVEGEATALYLARLLNPLGIKVTRIARGLPEGGDLDYADDATLVRALEGRRVMETDS